MSSIKIKFRIKWQKARIIRVQRGGIMDDKFLCGIILGMIGGAVLATNSAKARQIVRDGQEQVKEKLNEVGKKSKNTDNE